MKPTRTRLAVPVALAVLVLTACGGTPVDLVETEQRLAAHVQPAVDAALAVVEDLGLEVVDDGMLTSCTQGWEPGDPVSASLMVRGLGVPSESGTRAYEAARDALTATGVALEESEPTPEGFVEARGSISPYTFVVSYAAANGAWVVQGAGPCAEQPRDDPRLAGQDRADVGMPSLLDLG